MTIATIEGKSTELRYIKAIRHTMVVELRKITTADLTVCKQVGVVVVVHHFLKLICKLVSLLSAAAAARRKLSLTRSYSIIVGVAVIITPAGDYLAIISNPTLLRFNHEE